MCNLYNYSISALRVAILFLTFSFGVYTVAKVNGFLLSDDESVELSENVAAIPISNGPDRDLNPLVVEYECSLVSGDSSNALFTATNRGSEPVHFDCKGDGPCRFDVVLADAFSTSGLNVRGEAFVRDLAPGESAVVSVPIPLHHQLHELFFSFRFGKNGWRRDGFVSIGKVTYGCNIPTVLHEQ